MFLGPPGTGKTHLSIALGVQAVRRGHRVAFATAHEWVLRLGEAKKRGCLDDELERLGRTPLVICDEVGYIPFDPEAAALFFALVSSRYERSSLIVSGVATRTDKVTSEISQKRYEPDADLHFEGHGELTYGTKFVVVAARSTETRVHMIVDVDWVTDKGSEAKGAMGCFERLTPLVAGAQGVIYDTALRGVHHQTLLRNFGLIPVNKVTAKMRGAKKPRRAEGQRVEKSIHVEEKRIRLMDGSQKVVSLFARAGAIGIVELSDTGEPTFMQLRRVRTHRNRDKSGLYRWYNDYQLPDSLGGGFVTVRLHGNHEDAARGFNRTENVRPISPSDPDFKALYARRNDAESINRSIDDSLWLSRAHSVGHTRQHLNLIGYALMVNSLALLEHRQAAAPVAA